jgi:hypothetical protein
VVPWILYNKDNLYPQLKERRITMGIIILVLGICIGAVAENYLKFTGKIIQKIKDSTSG